MVKKSMNCEDKEPEQRVFENPSEGEKVFQIVDLFPDKNNPDIIAVKLEVSEGDEMGRTMLHRVNLDEGWKGFFLTRLFLKAIGEPYKSTFDVDTDMWIGKQFVASVVHNKATNGKTYANIDKFNFDRVISANPGGVVNPEDIAWKE